MKQLQLRSWYGSLVVVALLGVIVLFSLRSQSVTTAQAETAPVTVVLDAGHGGEDGGATGVSGSCESALNLEVCLRMQALLRLCGVEPVMVRSTDTAVYSEGKKTIAEKKVSDIHNRAALVNRTPNALLVSIHQNMFTESKYSGAQVFYVNNSASKALAETTQQLLREQLAPENHRAAKCAPSTVYLMNHINCTGILVECGFLSNAAEEALLQTPGYQTKLAVTITAAVLGYMEAQHEV